MKTQSKPDVYEIVTDRIIALLEAGTVPWRKPWKSQTGIPRNFVSRKAYRGINTLLLHCMNYESPYWLTYKQAEAKGGNVRKGEKACPVVFWKKLEIEDSKTQAIKEIAMIRYYHVFNVAQCEGLELPETPAATITDTTPIEAAHKIVDNWKAKPTIEGGHIKAYYLPSRDFIGMPEPESFVSMAHYYQTLFHELTHSTGHASRLNRESITGQVNFGSQTYSKEELLAEMGAAFLSGHAGISESQIENSAAYIASWLEALKNDRKLVVCAAAAAQKAVDYILGTSFEADKTADD